MPFVDMTTLVQDGCKGRLTLHVKAFLHHNSDFFTDINQTKLCTGRYTRYQYHYTLAQRGFNKNTNVKPRVINQKQNNKG